ncbi:MAG: hypothetical protein ACK6BQ_06305 [Bacteroidota bacterium]
MEYDRSINVWNTVYSSCTFGSGFYFSKMQRPLHIPTNIISLCNASFHIIYLFCPLPSSPHTHQLLCFLSFPVLLPNTYYLLPTMYYLLPTTYYILPTTYYLLPTTYYLLPTTSYLLPTTYYLLPTTYYQLPTTYFAHWIDSEEVPYPYDL